MKHGQCWHLEPSQHYAHSMYFRSHLPETSRFLSFVQGKVQETAASLAEATKGLDDELSRNLDGQAAKLLENSEGLYENTIQSILVISSSP